MKIFRKLLNMKKSTFCPMIASSEESSLTCYILKLYCCTLIIELVNRNKVGIIELANDGCRSDTGFSV